MEKRIKILSIFFLVVFVLTVGKLFYWQILKGKSLVALASKQYFTYHEVTAERGKIFSQDNFPLALNRPSFLLFANPKELEISPFELKDKIKEFVEISDDKLKNLQDSNLLWVSLGKDFDETTKQKIESLKIAGLGFEKSQKRFYPEASIAAQLLGFVGLDEEGKDKGYFGLEGYYDSELKGKNGMRYFEQDALGRPIPLSEETGENPVEGRSLLLSIDRPLQFLAEKNLKEGIDKYKASSGQVIIMNPSDGSILAMASSPAYDQAKYYLFEPDLYRNPAVSSSFEPGSIFKVIVMAIGLETGAIRKDETCSICYGPRTISGYSIKTWNEKYYPDSSMTDIIVHSDNVGMVYIADKIGVTRFYDYIRKFGFGEKSNIDLQGEISPILREKQSWREIDLATASFGQGIAVSPIQMISAVSAIANGGILYQPQVVKKIFENNRSISIEPVRRTNPISPNTAKVVTQMMVEAVEKGEAKWAKPKGYSIAGKTGTAQIPIAGHYDPEKTIASFVGFAPAENPKFVMLVTLSEPKSSPWGSETAAPLWFDIARDIFRVWGIPASK